MGQKSLNRWQGIGFVGKDPELRYTPKGTSVCNISLACTRAWKGADGEKQERTDWIPLVAWDKLADLVAQYVHKGQLIWAEGVLQLREAERDGVKYMRADVVLNDIIFLRSKDGAVQPARQAAASRPPSVAPQGLPSDDDIPF